MIVKELLSILDKNVPFSSSETWDNVGLLIGDEEKEVTGILTTLDCTLEVVNEAIENNYNTIIAHHPLIFKGVKTITNDGYGPIIKKLIKHDIHLIALHTNLDVHHKGVSYMMAKHLELENIKVLDQQKEVYYKVQIFLPDNEVEKMKKAMDQNGLARTKEYSEVFFETKGKGQFKPSSNANPHIGKSNETEYVHETKLEFMIDENEVEHATHLINTNHPYEEPVYDFIKMTRNVDRGLGILGELKKPINIDAFAKYYKEKLNMPAVRYIGNQSKEIQKIAIVGGAAVEYAKLSKMNDADLFITGDVKHHEALDALMDDINILDVNHYSEYVMKDGLKNLLNEWLDQSLIVASSNINTDPYNYM